MHWTLPTIKVFFALGIEKSEMYGLQIIQRTGVKAGTVYPILMRLEQEKFISSRTEEIDPKKEHRQPRVYYQVTEDGLLALKALQVELRFVQDFEVSCAKIRAISA
jgi:PadR family transcriptional regulator, regulatory protein PadR